MTEKRFEQLLAKAERHKASGKVAPARKAIRQALKVWPDHPVALLRLATLELDNGDPKGAVPVLRRLAEVKPGEPAVRLRLASALKEAGDAEEAEQTLRQLVADAPHLPRAHHDLGRLLESRQAFEEAFDAYATALKLDAASALYWRNAGRALESLGDYARAVDHFSSAIERKPQDPLLHYFRARAKTALEQIEPALADVDRCLALDPGNIRGLALQGVLFAKLGRDDEAQILFDYDRFLRPMRPEPPAGFADIETFNQAVIDHILKRAALEYDPPGVSTQGGWHSGNLLLDPHPIMASLRAMLQSVFETYLTGLPAESDHPFLRQRFANVSLVAQAQVLESDGYLKSHIHPNSWVSGAYYLAIPDVVSQGADNPGWIEFGRPTDEIRTEVDLETRCVKPEPGLAVLFPSYFFHGTRPFASESPRISMGVDVRPRK